MKNCLGFLMVLLCMICLAMPAGAAQKQQSAQSQQTAVQPAQPQQAAQPAQQSGVYHGNSNSRIYHNSKCKQYNCKGCTVRFNSAKEATDKGFKPCKRCGG